MGSVSPSAARAVSGRSARSSGFLSTAYLTSRVAPVAVLSLPHRAWFRNRLRTWSSASLIRETMRNGSRKRPAFGGCFLTPASIRMEARRSSVGCRKNGPSASLPYPSCARTTRSRLWSTATVMHVCPLPVAGLVHAHRGETVEHGRHRGFQAGGDPARDMAGRPARDAWESAHGLLVGGRHRPRIPHPEIPGEPAARLRPRHSGDHHAMLRARLARRQAHELDPMAAEVLVAPSPPPSSHSGHLRPQRTPGCRLRHRTRTTGARAGRNGESSAGTSSTTMPLTFGNRLNGLFGQGAFFGCVSWSKNKPAGSAPHTLEFNGSPTNHHPREQQKSPLSLL